MFVKGKSGNPGGRPKGVAALAREYSDHAVDYLGQVLMDDEEKTADRIAAAREILDRGFGKAVAMSANVTDKLDDATVDELRNLLEEVRSAEASLSAGNADSSQARH